MKKNKKISQVLAITFAGALFVSPLNYAKAEETSTTTTSAEPSSEVETTERAETTETTEKELVVTKWVEILEEKEDIKDKDKEDIKEKDKEKEKEKEKETKPKEKDLKPEKKGETSEEAGKIEGYEFVRTDKSEPGVVKHIFKKKDIVTKWEDSEGKELKPEAKGKEVEKSGTIDGYVFETTEKSKDGLTVTHIFKKKDGADTKKTTETSKEAESKKTEDKTKTDIAPKVEETTTKVEDTTVSKTKEGETTTVSTTEKPVPQNATEAITTGTNNDGAQNPIVQTTSSTETTTTKKDVLPTPPKYTSIFVNEKTGYEIANAREGKSKIDISGYDFVKTVEAEDGKFIHYYKAKNVDTKSTKTTVWKDVYSEEQLLSAKSGDHQAGYITGYTYVTTKNFGTTTVHYFKKIEKEKVYNWSFHRDVDTGEIIYYDFNRTGWHHPISILGYAYVDTDAWTDSAGITYHTHYYQRISTPIVQVDPAKVFTVWVDEHYNQILPSRMGSHEAGELDGYEFDRTVSINSGYGVAHVFKKVDGEERLAGKDKDKSMGYRVRSMLPRTSSAGGTNYLPLVATGAGVGAIVGAIVYFVMRRKNNNDQNNNNFPPHSGQ